MLKPQERELFVECLRNREATMSWTFEEIGRVNEDVAPPQRIQTIPHDAWQAPQFPIPKGLHKVVIEMLNDRLKKGVLERCHGPY